MLTYICSDDLDTRKESVEQLENTVYELAYISSEENFRARDRDYEDSKSEERELEDMTLDDRFEFDKSNPDVAENYL